MELGLGCGLFISFVGHKYHFTIISGSKVTHFGEVFHFFHYICIFYEDNIMDTLSQIRDLLSKDLSRYDDFIRLAFKHEEDFIAEMLDYLIEHRGKGIRPILALLMANIHSRTGVVSQRAYLVAMMVEMLHTASLVHDDIIDNAEMRHGADSVNARFGSHSAVVIGDYILAKAFSSGMESGQFDLVNYITRTLKTLCEGELIQTNVSNSLDMTRDKYYDIIYRKTASLLGTCCGAGALASGADHTAVAVARQIGDNLGMAFQIKDDLLDYAPSSQTGKPTCADLKEHKITLPLLIVLEEATPEEQTAIKELVRAISEKGESTDKIYALVERADAVNHSVEVMESYLNAARSMIKTYPETPYRDALLSLCDYIGKRSF